MQQAKLRLNRLMLVLGLIMGSFSFAFSQGIEAEPNDTCPTAQNIGAITLPFTVDGSLDTPPEDPDVDFFKVIFTDTPDTLVQVELEGEVTGKGTLSDPFLGVFDSNCNLIALNDDSGGTLNSRLLFTVPADGVFVLAATSCCDESFTGNGGSSGSYQLTVTLAPPPIGFISGRVVDAFTGEPLPGDDPPFAFVELFVCDNGECFEFVNGQSTDSQGRFRFDRSGEGNPLLVGTYQIRAFADQFQPGQTEPFGVTEGEDRDVGDILLTPPPVQFSEIRPCQELSPAGGRCRYSVKVTNTSAAFLTGRAWSVVNGSGVGSPVDFTVFQTGFLGPRIPLRQPINLAPGESQVLRFTFRVPSTVTDGAFICTEVFVGEDPTPSLATVGQQFLFCISKGGNEFRMVPTAKARQQFQRLQGKTRSR